MTDFDLFPIGLLVTKARDGAYVDAGQEGKVVDHAHGKIEVLWDDGQEWSYHPNHGNLISAEPVNEWEGHLELE